MTCWRVREVCHDSLVDLAGEEAFEASNDLTRGPAVRRAASHVFDGRLVEPHADEHGSIEGGRWLVGDRPDRADAGRWSSRTRPGSDRRRTTSRTRLRSESGRGYRRRGSTSRPQCRRRPRSPHEGRCCTNRHWPARGQSTGSSPADAIRRWSAESGHPIQDLTAEDGLTPLPSWAPGAKTSSDDGLVSEERVLHPALTMVP